MIVDCTQGDVAHLAKTIDPQHDHLWSALYVEWCRANHVRIVKPAKNPCARLLKRFNLLI